MNKLEYIISLKQIQTRSGLISTLRAGGAGIKARAGQEGRKLLILKVPGVQIFFEIVYITV